MDDSELEREREAMVRWQGYSREQRSTVNSLFLTFAGALLGLQSSILLAESVKRVSWAGIFVASGGLVLISLTAGCSVVLVRLRDARLTARIARFRVEKQGQVAIDNLKRSVKKLGKWTNRLITFQVLGFALAAAAFVIWLLFSFGAKFAFSDS
jgi:hypothetical protein